MHADEKQLKVTDLKEPGRHHNPAEVGLPVARRIFRRA
jgi:hypothetical protein